MKKTGIILTTFNKLDLTKTCLKSLIQNTTDYELIVVDNMSDDGTREWLKEQNIKTINFDEWVSVAVVLNAGIRYFFEKETNDISYDICWIHNDMTFYPGWLDALEKYLEDNPKCGRVASHNMRDQLAPERSGNELPFLIRGHCFKSLGMFDENFMGSMGYEDWDMNKRLIENDWTVMITPESRVFHTGMGTRKDIHKPDWESNNSQVYFKKWGTYDSPV